MACVALLASLSLAACEQAATVRPMSAQFRFASGPSTRSDDATWLFERLTFPSDEWLEDDFGTPPSLAQQSLLRRLLPRFSVAPGSYLPIDFYDSYLPRTVVRDAAGSVVREQPDAFYLKSIERRPGWCLDYVGDAQLATTGAAPPQASVYAVIKQETLVGYGAAGSRELEVTILRYNVVFPFSGLPAGLSSAQETLASLSGSVDRWHELDMHGATYLVLDTSTDDVIALILAQHNHYRTFVVGVDVQIPADSRFQIGFAKRSNEPYLVSDGVADPVLHRTVGRVTDLEYVISGRQQPLLSGFDEVYGPDAGGVELDCRIVFPASRDPLLVAWICLGDAREGRRPGPPGMNINTWPPIAVVTEIAQLMYFGASDTSAFRQFDGLMESLSEGDYRKLLEHNSRRFWVSLARRK